MLVSSHPLFGSDGRFASGCIAPRFLFGWSEDAWAFFFFALLEIHLLEGILPLPFLSFLIHYLLLITPPSRRLDLFFYPFFTSPRLFYVFIVAYCMY